MGSKVVRRTLIRAVKYSKVARSTTVTSRVLPKEALLRTLGASLMYSTVGATVERLFLRVICKEARDTFSRSKLPVKTKLRSLKGKLHSRINAVCKALGGKPHCLRVASNCMAKVTLGRSSRVVKCRFMGFNGVVSFVGTKSRPTMTLRGTGKRCKHISSTIGVVSPEGRWKKLFR